MTEEQQPATPATSGEADARNDLDQGPAPVEGQEEGAVVGRRNEELDPDGEQAKAQEQPQQSDSDDQS